MEVKEEDGRILVRVESMTGAYRTYDTRVDALFGEVMLHLGITGTRGNFPSFLRDELRINHSTVSKVRLGKEPLYVTWLLKLHAWSGMPLTDLETLSGISCGITPWPKGTK